MLYLDYAKSMGNGFILNFFADSIDDIQEVSNGKKFVTLNGTDYGIPQPSSTIVITMPDKTKKTYVLNEGGEWVEGGVKEDPTFKMEYNVAAWGNTSEYTRRLAANFGAANSQDYDNNEKWLDFLKNMGSPYVAIKDNGGYYQQSYNEEEGNGVAEWGKMTSRWDRREPLNPDSKYRVRLYPKIYIDISDNVGEFYEWVCKIVARNDDFANYGGFLVNEDCQLSVDELDELQITADASDSKNPDIYAALLGYAEYGAHCDMLMTKKECNYLCLEVVEI